MARRRSRRQQPNLHIALEIQTLLDEPLSKDGNPTIGTDALAAVLTAIKDALLRGEKVSVEGFGIFKIVQRTPHPTPNNYLTHDIQATGIKRYRSRPRVIFEPALPLLAMLNLDSPNYKERRAQRRWVRQESTSHEN